MKITRRKSRTVKIGKISIGGNQAIAIQSMLKSKTSNIAECIAAIKTLEHCGCEIVRLAVKDPADTKALAKIKSKAQLPLVADIHFDWRLAIEAMESGVDKIRLNPGNIFVPSQVREIAKVAKRKRIPIRVGLNSGSLPKSTANRQPSTAVADKMVKSALDYIKILESCGFYNIVISLKGSDILETMEAYRKIAKLCDYPMHLGVTVTGASFPGTIKSAIAIGNLLSQGIGDTIRISLTDTPEQEVRAAKAILTALNLRNFGPEIISCPTCGRCEVDLVKIVNDLELRLSRQPSTVNRQLNRRSPKIALMGCIVNGPGEAKEADLGIAFGKKDGLFFKNGKPLSKVSYKKSIGMILKELRG